MNTMPERTATPAELCDEITRAERARTGQQLPRTLHALCEQAARLVVCTHCGARPGMLCDGLDGYHLARFVTAFTQRLITPAEAADVIAAAPIVFTSASLIRDAR